MQFCYCGDCPSNIPRADSYEFLCYECADARPVWDDAQEITYAKCSQCGRQTFVSAKLKRLTD